MNNETMSRIELPDDFADALAKGEIKEDVLKEIQRVIDEHSYGVAMIEPIPPLPIIGGFALAGLAEYTHKLGTHTLPNNTRVHKHGTFDYRFETQSVKWEVFITFRHPTMTNFIEDAIECVGAAAVGSVIVAVVLESPQVGLAIFEPAWKLCMAGKVGKAIANDIQVELTKNNVHGPWTNH
jgi:hypothetical protein